MNEKTVPLFILATLILGGAGVYFLTRPPKQTKVEIPVNTPVSTKTLSMIPTATPTSTLEFPEGWKIYKSDRMNLQLGYPQDVELKEISEQSFVLTKWGPTQKEGTEFYDGISLSFSFGLLGNRALEQVAQTKHGELKNEPVIESVSAIDAQKIGNRTIYKFSAASLGKRDYLYLSHREGEYLEIVDSTQDPTDQGFDLIVKKVLKSIQPLNKQDV